MKILIAALLMTSMTAQACFLTGSRVSGMNRICYYNCVGGTRAITVSAASLCPMSLGYSAYREVWIDGTGIMYGGCDA